jgi:L-proline---[L-prolyl-carrier protein] ligase
MLIHERVAQAAARHQHAPAVVHDGEILTYGQLFAWAEQLAEVFAAALSPGDRVALNLQKSPAAIAAMIGTLLAGCTYVPIDPASPMLRRRFIVQDSGAAALVLDAVAAAEWSRESPIPNLALLVGTCPALPAVQRASLAPPGQATRPLFRKFRQVQSSDLAYVLYTSGSTGEPKGVMITHGNAAGFVTWALDQFDIGSSDRIAIHAPLHFDLPVLDVYAGLARGACLFPVNETTARFPEALLRFLRQHEVSVLYAVPSALTALVSRSTLFRNGMPSLRLLLYAGEEFQAAPLARLMAAVPGARVFNLYGPIETNVVTVHELSGPPAPGQRIPIGHAIAGTEIFLVGNDGALIWQAGLEGEIVVSGPTVSPGYLNRPELTAKTRLVIRRGGTEQPAYRTGDLGVWRDDGLLQFLGRRDGLVKTRGFRVDLGDIEATLSACPGVAEVAVIAVPDPQYTTRLLGFVVPAPQARIDEPVLVAWCRHRLPLYMVPERISVRERLPRTSTGKIARKILVSNAELVES